MDNIDKTDLTEKKAPLITKYTCTEAPEGYNFVIIQNNEKDQTYKESVDYSTFDGLSFIGNAGKTEETKYELLVAPGETKIVIMEANVQGFSSGASMSTQLFQGDKTLAVMCKTEENKA